MSRAALKTVISFEIVRQLKKPSFWIALLLVPLFIFAMFFLSASDSTNLANLKKTPLPEEKLLGLTDEAGIIADTQGFTLFENQETGITAVKDGRIDFYYHIPKNFAEKPVIDYYSKTDTFNPFTSYDAPIRDLLTATAAKKTDTISAIILSNNFQTSQVVFDKTGKEVNFFGQALIPFLILGIFYVLICVFGNRLLMAVVEEKENRISEMILTAVSAKNLIIGKIIALIALGLLQIFIFILPIISIVIIKHQDPFIAGILNSVEINPLMIAANLLLLFLSYFLFAGAATFIGSLVPTARDASQYFSAIILPVISPLFFISSFTGDPNFITYFLSYFPLSAPIALMIRNATHTLPWYEFLLGLADIAIFSGLFIFLTIRSFQKNAINFSVVKPNFKIRKTWRKA